MKFKHLLMRLMVFNMKWMTRYLGFIALPIVKLVADNEIIACGIKSQNNEINIIYTPTPDRLDHFFYKYKKEFKKQHTGWEKTLAISTVDFSQQLVHQATLPTAKIGDVYKVKAQKVDSKRQVSSPNILIKNQTIYDPNLVQIKTLPQGQAEISWKKAKLPQAMIYFLVVEDNSGQNICGIYTRETFWTYPLIKKASYYVGNPHPPLLQKGRKYTVKLVVVDFDGWTPYLAQKTFTG